MFQHGTGAEDLNKEKRPRKQGRPVMAGIAEEPTVDANAPERVGCWRASDGAASGVVTTVETWTAVNAALVCVSETPSACTVASAPRRPTREGDADADAESAAHERPVRLAGKYVEKAASERAGEAMAAKARPQTQQPLRQRRL